MTDYDTTTLNGSLLQLGDTMASNLNEKGVTDASVNDGLTTLAGRILDINTGDVFKIEADETLVGIGDTVTLTATVLPYVAGKTIKLYKDDVFVANMIDQHNGYYEYTITTDTVGVFSFKAKDDDKYTTPISITVKDETTIKITSISGLRTLESDFIEYLYDGDEFKVTGTLQDNNSNPISNQEVKIFLHDDYICKTVTDNHGEFIATGINPFYPFSSEFNDMTLKAVYNGSEVYFASEDSSTIVYRHISLEDEHVSLNYLQKLINVARDNKLHLTHDFEYIDGDVGTGVLISNPLTIINGHGYTIDGKETVRLFNITSNTILNDLNIENGKQANTGGAIIHTAGTLELNNCNFDNCQAVNSAGTTYYYGGAVYTTGTGLTVKNSSFNNTKGLYGGAIYTAGQINVYDSSFVNSIATGVYGGGIYSTSNLNVYNSSFVDCSGNYGGAIYSNKVIQVFDSSFVRNSATNYAGAIFSDGGTLTLVRDSFIDCTSASAGAVCFNGGSGSVTNSSFIGCRGTAFGGAIVNYFNGLVIDGSLFLDCYAEGQSSTMAGGVMYAAGSTTVKNSIILNCTSGSVSSNNQRIFSNAAGSNVFTLNYNWWGHNSTNKNSLTSVIPAKPVASTLDYWLYLTSMIDDDDINIGEKSKIKFDLNHYATTSTTRDYDARNVAKCELDLIVAKGVLNKEKITIKNGISEIITFKATEAGEGMVIPTRDHIDYDIINIMIN